MVAGGDVILVLHRFEPCETTQLYGFIMAPALFSKTGGLADAVVDSTWKHQARTATGFVFEGATWSSPPFLATMLCLMAKPRAWAMVRLQMQWNKLQLA